MLKVESPAEFRKLCKFEKFSSQTSGYCPGYSQANLVVVPKEAAQDFTDLCFRNPVPIPLLGVTSIGNPNEINNKNIINDKEFDIRTDFPTYNIYERGKLVGTKTNIKKEWDFNSHVGFLIGCSFSFENALTQAGLPPKNGISNKNVSMYVTNKNLDSAGIFVDVPYVVSMRPYKAAEIEKVRSISRQFRKTHGEPIDWGYDAVKRLGIKDINNPEFGDSTDIAEDEIPVFWGCGVTAQFAAKTVGEKIPGLVFAHYPGHMLILDIKDSEIIQL